ncbi:MAG: porin family protein [Bacteroides sp.]|nr:porin family protein [Bacteroides sp.]
MKKQWNKDVRDQLKDFPKKAPEGLLDDIKSEMVRRGLSPSPVADKPKHLYPSVFRRVASVAAVLLILLGLSLLWKKPANLPVVSESPDASQEPILPTLVTEEKTLEEPSLAMPSASLIAKAEKKVVSPSEKTDVKEEEKEEDHTAQQEEEAKDKEEKQPQKREAQETKKKYTPTSSKPKWTYNVSKRKKSAFSLGIQYSGVVAQSNLNFEKDYYNIALPPQNNPNNPPNPDGGDLENPDSNNGIDTTSVAFSRAGHSAYNIYNFSGKATHHLPVKFGLSLRYVLNERWNLQSGLNYSYLASDLEETKLEEKYNIKQKLHYLGIPLQIGYRIWEGKQFRSYIAAGGQVEKLVSGKAAIRHSKKNQLQDTSTQNINDKKLLYSALVSIGTEYMLNNNFSLYIEPNIHYYFKNGNGLQTHYNEQPLNINLTVGFRFHWEK